MNFKINKYLEVPSRSKSHNCHPSSKSPDELKLLSCNIVKGIECPKEFQWNIEDVSIWIENLGFPQYKECLKINMIDGRRLIHVDAPALIKMNIKNFDDIKIITQSIRKMYGLEMENPRKNLTHLPFAPYTLFKYFKAKTGYLYQTTEFCEFLRLNNLLDFAPESLNHFELLHEYLKHLPVQQSVRIGLMKRLDLYFVKSRDESMEDFDLEADKIIHCTCDIPPCECKWTHHELKRDLKMTILKDYESHLWQ